MNKATDNKTREEWMKWLKYYKNHRYELTKEECIALRDAIKKYACVAEEFFFRTLDPMTKGFAHKVYETYNVVVDFRDIATCIYLAMYDGGKWSRWDTYRGDCGIFAWISFCATQAVFTELEELHYIETSSDLTAKNSSLTLKSMRHKDEVMMVLDLIEVPQMHELLTRIYVMRMTDEEIMTKMNMSEELFKKTRKVAETMLKECLINEGQMLVERADGKTVNLVSEALSDLSGKIKTSTSDEAMLAADKMFSGEDEFEELKEALEQFYPGLPWMEQWVNFVLDRAAELNWNEEDETVFYERFYHHTDPVSLAKRLGRARTWIDNKFSRENKALIIYIKNGGLSTAANLQKVTSMIGKRAELNRNRSVLYSLYYRRTNIIVQAMRTKMTVGSAFETIAKELKDSKFNKDKMDAIAKEVRFLKRMMGLTMIQSCLVSVFLENAGETVTCQELAEYVGVSRIRIMTIHSQIDDLVKRGFLTVVEGRVSEKWNMRYSATTSLVNAVRYNHEIIPYDYSETSNDDMWQMISSLLHECDYSNISYQYMVQQLRNLISGCTHLDFCCKLSELNLSDDNLVLLLVVCNCLVIKNEDYASTGDYDDIIPYAGYGKIIRQFKSKSNELVVKNLVQATNDDCDEYRLTKDATLQLLGKAYLKEEEEENVSESQKITAKEMFYNPEEAAQIERLTNLLKQENFAQIQSRMSKVGMRPGFCAHFYGAPGTGKTETVLQLARKSGREIVQVDLSNIKDKWVGESEKNIKAIFTDYSQKLASSKIAPILFFNEADGIFGKRHTDINSEVEHMSNAMQNIILQAMEDFEGILIATTNLTDNLDSAFERRFLYKIEFKKPSVEVRKKIWLSMVPELGEKNAEVLASRYDFSGGQIENVARRMMVDAILYGRTLTGKEVVSACDEEQFGKKKSYTINKKSA